MSEALDPARFFIRDVKRARPPRRAQTTPLALPAPGAMG
jgi:hypothetical protein